MFKKTKTINKSLFLVGLIICLLPYGMQSVGKYQFRQEVQSAKEEIKENNAVDSIFESALRYNQRLFENGDTSGYEQELNPLDTGFMASIEIPKLNLELPIYHTSTVDVLAVAIGHIEWSSLPVGGENCHTILAGHSGCAQNSFFSHLDSLQKKDQILIHVCDRTLTYEIDKIEIILPDQLEGMDIEEGEDRISLATCTPFGINTHRLIVSAIRT